MANQAAVPVAGSGRAAGPDHLCPARPPATPLSLLPPVHPKTVSTGGSGERRGGNGSSLGNRPGLSPRLAASRQQRLQRARRATGLPRPAVELPHRHPLRMRVLPIIDQGHGGRRILFLRGQRLELVVAATLPSPAMAQKIRRVYASMTNAAWTFRDPNVYWQEQTVFLSCPHVSQSSQLFDPLRPVGSRGCRSSRGRPWRRRTVAPG